MEALRKPAAICVDEPFDPDFITHQKHHIEQHVQACGLHLRDATLADLPRIVDFHWKHWPTSADVMSATEDAAHLSRIITHGLVVLLEDAIGDLHGCNLNEHWADGTQYAPRNTVADAGKQLGSLLPLYAALRGYEAGLRVRRATVHPTNVAAVLNLLNRVGFIATGYQRQMPGLGERLLLALPLTLDGLQHNRIDLQKLNAFCRNRHPDHDVRVVSSEDAEGLEAVYAAGYQIVATFAHQFVAVRLG